MNALCGGFAHLRRIIERCPVCQCRTETVMAYPGTPYLAPSVHCCKCGDSWCEGELGVRPFARGWRVEAVAWHRDMWVRASYGVPSMAALYPELLANRSGKDGA